MEHRPVSLFSGLALKQVFDTVIVPAFTAERGYDVDGTYEPTKVLVNLVATGSRPDVMIGVDASLRDVAGHHDPALSADSITPLVRSGLGVAVPHGATQPDISTTDAFVRTLLAAQHVAYSTIGASGVYFARLIDRLGIADEINESACVVEKGFVAETLLDGRADLAIQQVVELATVTDIDIVGPFPPEAQHYVELSVGRSPEASRAACELYDFLFTATAFDAYRSVGMDVAGGTR